MSEYIAYLKRQSKKYGDKFDPSNLAPQFAPYLHSGNKITVVIGDEKMSGYVGVTTGYRPVFLLVKSLKSTGSSDILSFNDRVLEVFPKRRGR